MRENSDVLLTPRRRQLLALVTGAALGAGGHAAVTSSPTPSAESTTGTATITDLHVSDAASTVEDYSGFRLEAAFDTETGDDQYRLPTIYIVDTAAETVLPQTPGEVYDAGESGTYEMGFVAPKIEEPTTVVVHMGGAAASFEVTSQ